jgi:Beta-propeller repeat
VVDTEGGEVIFHKPVVYQPATYYEPRTTNKELVKGKYVVKGNHITFEIANYDKTRPLIIDPALAYSIYLGGSGGDYGAAIAVDSSGNTYVTGGTNSTNFPTTPGAPQTSYGGGDVDAFVTKLNASGSFLLFSTYLGGSSGEGGQGIAVDSSGNIYVTGSTGSSNFPTTPGAFQTKLAGRSDAFVAKIALAGAPGAFTTLADFDGNTGSSPNFVALAQGLERTRHLIPGPLKV